MLCLLAATPAVAAPGYLSAPRARQALRHKEAALKARFAKLGLRYPPRGLFIRVFKRESVVELWVRRADKTYALFKSYPVCYASGSLGPKRRQGDRQVPEGFYRISALNPWSSYHLSMRVSYPNKADRILGHRRNLGGAIMIHGDCVSIGCVAITDDRIEEVYVLAARAYAAGRRLIPVHVFPTRMDDAGMARLRKLYQRRQGLKTFIGWLRLGQRKRWDRRGERLLAFWSNLRPGYLYFEQHRRLPRVTVDRRGRYVIRARGKTSLHFSPATYCGAR